MVTINRHNWTIKWNNCQRCLYLTYNIQYTAYMDFYVNIFFFLFVILHIWHSIVNYLFVCNTCNKFLITMLKLVCNSLNLKKKPLCACNLNFELYFTILYIVKSMLCVCDCPHLRANCTIPKLWFACLTRKKYILWRRTCIQLKDNFATLSITCLTACFCLLCRWRWMHTISAIVHAPKVSAYRYTNSGFAVQGDLHSLSEKQTQACTYILCSCHCKKFQTAEFPFFTIFSISLFMYLRERESHLKPTSNLEKLHMEQKANKSWKYFKTTGNSIWWHTIQLVNIVLVRPILCPTVLWQMNDNLVGSQNHSLVTSNRQIHHPLACHSCSSTIFNIHQCCAV